MIEYQHFILASKLYLGSDFSLRQTNQQNSKEDSDTNSLKLVSS
jgi:hypothetical protein